MKKVSEYNGFKDLIKVKSNGDVNDGLGNEYKIPNEGFSSIYKVSNHRFRYNFNTKSLEILDSSQDVIDEIDLSAEEWVDNPDYWAENYLHEINIDLEETMEMEDFYKSLGASKNRVINRVAKMSLEKKASQALIAEVEDGLYEIRGHLQDAIVAARNTAKLAKKGTGRFSAVVAGQLQQYLIGTLENYCDSESQPGSIASLNNYLANEADEDLEDDLEEIDE